MSIRRIVSIEQAQWSVGPAPEWVELHEPDWQFGAPPGHQLALLLVDAQEHVATGGSTHRVVRQLLTAAAVQSLSQVEIDFDPAAHRLVIHELAVWRRASDGLWQKRSMARRDAFLLRQREQQFDRQILTGRLSLVALLEDVRVGDAIEQFWSLEPLEQLPGMRFASFFSFAWGGPVARASYQLHLEQEQHPVRWRVHAREGVTAPQFEERTGSVTWRVERPPPLEWEPNAPLGDWPFAVVDVTGWRDWAEVAAWIDALWSDALAEGAESVLAEAARLRATGDAQAGIRAAIRFVQEEIRYLALDFGFGGGLLPSGAGEVLRRRFGDCKDKTVLLCALLRALGCEAWPLLVAPSWRAAVTRVQPSTGAFSHSIVTFLFEGRRCFVDPTLVGQGGELRNLASLPFGAGLEVRASADALLTLPDPAATELTITETFYLDRAQRRGSCDQLVRAVGSLADDLRAAFVRQGPAVFLKERTEALQRHFPALTAQDEAPVVRDDWNANALEFHARYALPTWGAKEAVLPAKFTYGAHGLSLALDSVEGPEQRRLPWLLRFPMKLQHRVVVRGDCVQKTSPETHRQDGPGFRYSCEVTSARNEVVFDYRWETTQPAVSPSDWPSYRAKRLLAFQHSGANVATQKAKKSTLAWAMLAPLILLVIVRMVDVIGREIARDPNPTPSASHAAAEEPDPLREAFSAARRGDFEEAERLVELHESRYRRRFDYQILRAETAIELGHLARARDALEAARAMYPDSPNTDLVAGELDEASGDLAHAHESLARAYARAPKQPPVIATLARVTERLGNAKQARDLWESLLRLQPGQPEALFHFALLSWRAGDRESADALMRREDEGPRSGDPRVQSARASYYLATDRPQEALAPAHRAAELAPDDAAAAARYALALEKAGDQRRALETAKQNTERFPKQPPAWGSLATIAANAGETVTAERAFRAWIELAPRNPRARANYALFLHRTGHSAEARTRLEEALRDSPGDGALWRSYAVVLDGMGEKAQAKRASRKADELLTEEQRLALPASSH